MHSYTCFSIRISTQVRDGSLVAVAWWHGGRTLRFGDVDATLAPEACRTPRTRTRTRTRTMCLFCVHTRYPCRYLGRAAWPFGESIQAAPHTETWQWQHTWEDYALKFGSPHDTEAWDEFPSHATVLDYQTQNKPIFFASGGRCVQSHVVYPC